MPPATIDPSVQGRPKTLDEAKVWMKSRLAARTHPMNNIESAEGNRLIDRLEGLDGESWAAVWGTAADGVMNEARQAERNGDTAAASALYQRASGLYFMGRFPCPNHPAKERCAIAEREAYVAASRHWPHPVQVVTVPFAGREGEGNRVTGYLRRPRAAQRPRVVVMWGGVDAWKEQMTAISDAFLARGLATIAMDNAGTGESPVKGVVDADRAFVTMFDWVAAQSDLDGARVGCVGRSFGGYWATRLAHLYPDRIAGAVNWGGGAHFMFQRDWIEASRYPDSYLMDLVETRKRMLGASTDEEYVAGFEQLSLLNQGLLDRPCAPLLLVNGKEDKQCPIADVHLLTEHGSPKSVRLFPGGHMGLTPQTLPTIVDWLVDRVRQH